jgi:hypothetical protein
VKIEHAIWLVILVIAGGWLAYRASTNQTGKGYYRVKPDGSLVTVPESVVREIDENPELSDAQKVERKKGIQFSWQRTVGLWVAGFFTLCILSFLYRDNPFYKIAEHVFVGISAAYWMVVGFWSTVVNNMLSRLIPVTMKGSWVPGVDLDDTLVENAAKPWLYWIIDYDSAGGDGFQAHWWQLTDFAYWIPMVLGVMLLWRLAPKGAWIARWPLAFIIGSTAGFRLFGYLSSDFVAQIHAAIQPLIDVQYDGTSIDWGMTFYTSFMVNTILLLATLAGLVYFFFSVEHKGVVGGISRVGIWVLMITFGAGFGFTVMGRIALLVGRFQFLVIDWLRIVEP